MARVIISIEINHLYLGDGVFLEQTLLNPGDIAKWLTRNSQPDRGNPFCWKQLGACGFRAADYSDLDN